MNSPCSPVPLLFITGFLGSGKTTLVNRVLDEAAAQGKKIGVIINEWGRVNIDSSLIRAKDIEIEELNDGQVFCSCLSGNFLEALVLLAKRSLDVVIVETSGMANPFPLRNILCDLKRLTGGHYVYQGMIALIDPESFLDLVGDINAVEEQVIASQRIIINKIELADGETLARIRKKIRQLNPHAGIIETSYACVEGLLDSSMHEVSTSSPLESKFVKRSAKESYTRPGQYIITTTEGLAPERVEAFVREILPGALRVKGILSDTEHGWFHVDGVNDKVETRVLEASGNESKIVIIPKAGDEIAEKLIAAWNTQCRVPFSLS